MAAWIAAISFDEWPQQRKLSDGQIRPSMVTKPGWHDFGSMAEPIMQMLGFNASQFFQPMLSVVMPGHSIPPHADLQAPYWRFRVHIPLLTNKDAKMTIRGKKYHLKVGMAYKINTEAKHAIENCGITPRVHFMFDVR